jgi:hypothetical protein
MIPESIGARYLAERGISLETVAQNQIEIRPSTGEERVKAAEFRRRLGYDRFPNGGPALHETVTESIWFACRDANTNILSWIVRPFHSLNGTTAKFLATKENGSYPYIPQRTWDIASKSNRPIAVTEGPVKCLSILQAGAFALGVNGVWLATCTNGDGQTDLHPAIHEFSLLGRSVFIAFDADYETNPEVLRALIRTNILFIKAGAEPKILTWPLEQGKGIDDYLSTRDAVSAFKELCDNACDLKSIIRPCHTDMVRIEISRAHLCKSKLSQICKLVARSLGTRALALEKDCESIKAGPPTENQEVEAYYDSHKKEYLVRNASDRWLSLTETQFKLRLRDLGISENASDGQMISPAEEVLLNIQDKFDVHYAGPLSGRDAGFYEENGLRILVTSSPKIIEPKEGEPTEDHPFGFPIFDALLKNMFAGPNEIWPKQAIYLFGWLQVAVRAARARKSQPGQALAFAGPVNSGKSLLQYLITEMIGGRMAKADLFLQGRTNFNSELFGAEHLMLEDENASTFHRDRMALASNIKKIAVNKVHPCHAKHRDIINIPPWWRLTISLNDRPERLLVLPPLDEDLGEKIILLQATCAPMPMPTATVEQREKFFQTLVSELPAFLWWLENVFVIPDALVSDRFGIREFHHPTLVTALNDISPAHTVLDMIDELKPWGTVDSEWRGTSMQLRTLLMNNDATRRDAQRILDWPNACGQYLGDLAKTNRDRVQDARTSTSRDWIIKRPENQPE